MTAERAASSPAPVGMVLVEHDERVLGELREAQTAVRAAVGEQPQRLALGTLSAAGQVIVPPALAALKRRHPAAELSLVDLEPPHGYGLVTAGELDLLITHRYPGVGEVHRPGADRQRLLADPLRLALPADRRLHGRSRSRGIGLAELAGETWVSAGPGVPNRIALLTLTADASFQPRVAHETADHQVTLALVATGLGVALVPESLLPDARHRGVSLRSLRGVRPHREISIVHRRRPAPAARPTLQEGFAAAPESRVRGEFVGLRIGIMPGTEGSANACRRRR